LPLIALSDGAFEGLIEDHVVRQTADVLVVDYHAGCAQSVGKHLAVGGLDLLDLLARVDGVRPERRTVEAAVIEEQDLASVGKACNVPQADGVGRRGLLGQVGVGDEANNRHAGSMARCPASIQHGAIGSA
jgi:hypothetical protein